MCLQLDGLSGLVVQTQKNFSFDSTLFINTKISDSCPIFIYMRLFLIFKLNKSQKKLEAKNNQDFLVKMVS